MTSTVSSQTSNASAAQLRPWRAIYNGVYHSVGASLVSFSDGSQSMQRVTALKVDLTASGIDFVTTSGTGEGNGQTVGTGIANFVETTTGVVLAINANLSGAPLDHPSKATSQLLGLAMTGGNVVCDPTKVAPGGKAPDVPSEDYVGCTALMISGQSGNFSATIGLATKANPPDTSSLHAAIAGSRNGNPSDGVPRKPRQPQIAFLVENSKICTFEEDTFVAGRTGVGVSSDGLSLYLVVVEGLEGCTPSYGATFNDLANWLVIAGNTSGESESASVVTAVSLDGGGSSVMAKLDPTTNRAVMLNIQYGDENGQGQGTPGAQRHVGNYFGIKANALSSA